MAATRKSNFTRVKLSNKKDKTNRKWKVVYINKNNFRLINKKTHMALDVVNDAQENKLAVSPIGKYLG